MKTMEYIIVNEKGKQQLLDTYATKELAEQAQVKLIHGAMLGGDLKDAVKYLRFKIKLNG